MSKDRTFHRRGKPVQLHELDVRAVRGVPAAEPAAGDPLPAAVRPDDADTFRRAGWHFVPAARAGGQSVKVFVRPSGGLVLGTDRLTVQLPGDPDSAAARRVLASHGVPVRQLDRLAFAPGLYHVLTDPPAGKDVLDLANELTASGAVVFAEPDLIEHFSVR